MIYKSLFADIHYNIVGKGNKLPILFCHGWGGDERSFLYFAKSFVDRKCILIDFPPFGGSSDIKSPMSVSLYAKLVIKILKENNIKDFYIVAHSFGARVACEMCKLGFSPQKMLITGGAGIKQKRNFIVSCKILHYKITKYFCKYGLLSFDKLRNFGSKEYQSLSLLSKRTFVNITNYDETPFLKYVCCPTLLFWGKKDKVTPFYFTKIYKKHIKNCGVVSASGGHFAYLQNSKLFLKLLHIFFN